MCKYVLLCVMMLFYYRAYIVCILVSFKFKLIVYKFNTLCRTVFNFYKKISLIRDILTIISIFVVYFYMKFLKIKIIDLLLFLRVIIKPVFCVRLDRRSKE
jgi:hypothetical protein